MITEEAQCHRTLLSNMKPNVSKTSLLGRKFYFGRMSLETFIGSTGADHMQTDESFHL